MRRPHKHRKGAPSRKTASTARAKFARTLNTLRWSSACPAGSFGKGYINPASRPHSWFVAAHESVHGTKLPFRDVRDPVAAGGKPDMARTSRFGSE
jgi:hypothetical protein